MDLGYRLLRHIFQQVFGNFGQAMRLTLLLTLFSGAPMVLFVSKNAEAVSQNIALIFVVVLPVWLFTSCWAAVGWHRYILLEENGTGVIPKLRMDRVGRYLLTALKLGMVLFPVGFAIGFLEGFLMAALPSQFVAVILSVSLTIVFIWTAIRIGLILPAAAIGEDLTIKQSWAATAPASAAILAPLFAIELSTKIVDGAIVAMFQGPILGAGLQVALYWIQMLLNLSLMTTLYGHLIHGRPLN
jgi:hypothetical protein